MSYSLLSNKFIIELSEFNVFALNQPSLLALRHRLQFNAMSLQRLVDIVRRSQDKEVIAARIKCHRNKIQFKLAINRRSHGNSRMFNVKESF